MCLMRHKKHKDESGDEVAFIGMAIDYGQKEVSYLCATPFISDTRWDKILRVLTGCLQNGWRG